MIKFKFTGERCAEVLSINQYLAIGGGSFNSALGALPLFVLDQDGEYIVKAVLDDDGDIVSRDGMLDAALRLSAVTPKRSEGLAKQLMEAVKSIVDPPKGGGSTKPSGTAPEPPPPG